MRTAFERRGRTMHRLLSGIPGVHVLEPQGAFYAFPNLSAYLGRSIRGEVPRTTVELCGVLLDHAKVATVPGEAFDAPGYARLSFALGDDDLGEGCRRIGDLLAEAS
jgi:aspartate/methionine/tyrosine aminotransferase